MVPGVCLSTTPTCNLVRQTDRYYHSGRRGCWSSARDREDASRGPSCSFPSVAAPVAVMNFGILPSGLGGSNLTRPAIRRVLNSSKSALGESWVPQHGIRVNCVTEIGSISRSPEDLSLTRIGSPVRQELLKRKRNRGVLGTLIRCQRWRVRATEDAEQDPLGEEGYWDGAEGKQQLNDIEDMKELIAEAESLQRAESAKGGADELASDEIEKQKAEKLREELARRAKQQAEQRKQAETMFGMGQRAYGRGVYDKSVQLLEAALSNLPRSSNLGGEIQIWLAMAYEADNRHGDCIALYKRIEATHPNKQIRRQAADLRYILEAPKLKISKEEMVSIPIIERDYDRGSKTWSQKVRDRRRKPLPKSKTKDYLEDWLVWDPPRWERNPYFWVAFTVWLTLVGVSLMFQD